MSDFVKELVTEAKKLEEEFSKYVVPMEYLVYIRKYENNKVCKMLFIMERNGLIMFQK